MKYSVVIPCYCSHEWLGELVQRIEATMDAIGDSYEILLVNDASPDGTWTKVAELAEKRPQVRGIDLMFNTGQFRTIMCGLEHARGDFIILLDDDLQNPPEEIPKLVEGMRSEPDLDCVMGAYRRKRHGLIRNMGSTIFRYLLAKLYGMPRSVKLTSFMLMKRLLAEGMCMHKTVSPVIGALIYRTTSRVANVEVDHQPRVEGDSGYRFSRLVRIVFDSVFGASVFPLRVVSFLGMTAAAGSVALGVYYLTQYFFGEIDVPGFITSTVLTLFFGGMTLFSVGMVGEYLIRIIDEVRGLPRHVVRQIATGKDNQSQQVETRSPHHVHDTRRL